MKWFLGIIEILSVMPPQVLVLHKWKGKANKYGVPQFMEKVPSCWDDVSSHFVKVQVHPDEVEVKFLNMIRSSSDHSTSMIHFSTRNTIDNGVQCSIFGPDVFVVPPPIKFCRLGSSFDFIKTNEHLKPAFCKSIHANKRNVRRSIKESMKNEDDIGNHILEWNLPSKVVCASSDVALFVVVSDHESIPLSKSDTTQISNLTKDCVYSPFFDESGNPIKQFKPITKQQYQHIVKKCKNGMPVQEFNNLLASQNDLTTELLHDVTTLTAEKLNHHGFIQLFAGSSAPPIDESFQRIEINKLRINYKFDKRNAYQSYIPLSTGLF